MDNIDHLAASYASSHDTSRDLSVVAPLSRLHNFAVPNTQSNSVVLSAHGILCCKIFGTPSALSYVDFMISM
jgi:hypothetical protein